MAEQPSDVAQRLLDQEQRLGMETRELDLLVESTQTEVNRLKTREDQARGRVAEIRKNPANFQRDEVHVAYEEFSQAVERRLTMEGQLASLQAKRKLMDRVRQLIADAAVAANQIGAPPPSQDGDSPPVIDEARLLQAVVDTQEEERKRIARQVHDGPAQALSNLVLQTEISERLFDIDPERSRQELGVLRQLVNRALQELRGFIFELRPMILDDLGLVPTLRRYVQTIIEKHTVRIEFSSTGRDRRLPSDDEVAIFRLIQDSLLERIAKGEAKNIQLATDWKDEVLETTITSDGRELPPDAELQSGLRRSERLELLKGEASHEQRADGSVVLTMRTPLRQIQTIG